MSGVFNRQPGFGAGLTQQWVSRQLSREAVQSDRLQVVAGRDAFKQCGQWHGAVSHVPFVRHVVNDMQCLRRRVLQQLGGLPRPDAAAQIEGELSSANGQAE